VCDPIPDFSYQETMTMDLECYDGWTDVGVFIYFDDELMLEECQECKPPGADEDDVIAYYFEVRMCIALYDIFDLEYVFLFLGLFSYKQNTDCYCNCFKIK
jgi:hypothetical protein